MIRARHISEAAIPRKLASRHGTVLMECVLVLPLLTLLIFTIVQFALIWYAQIMTHYAAYNAARAALVYHPGEYTETNKYGKTIFQTTTGVCHDAAMRTLAWVSASPDGGKGAVGIFGWSAIPSSSHISDQVRIDAYESKDGIVADDDSDYSLPAVKVKVYFDYPLHVPVIGSMLAYFFNTEEKSPSRWDVTGWVPSQEGVAIAESKRHKTMGVDVATLHAYCVLPKPWTTKRFGRDPRYVAAGDDQAQEVFK